MSNFICPECGEEIIDSRSGYVTGCEHFPEEDFTDLAGKHMSDGKSQGEADLLAFKEMMKQKELF